MSVQNLRNKFSQNNGTVPFKPPGLSFGNTLKVNNHNSKTVVSGLQVQQNGEKRFKTIREEPDVGTDNHSTVPSQRATRNTSFLQSYVAHEMTASPVVSVPVQVQASATNDTNRPPSAVVDKYKNAVRSPPAVHHLPKPKVSVATMSVKPMAKLSTSNKSLPATPQDNSSPEKFRVAGNQLQQTMATDGKWKVKFDETETKRKELLTQSQKLLRENTDMERQVMKLRTDLEISNKELSERTLQLSQLRKLSEAMYKEYDQLRQQYELETGTLHKAMERASQWYKQNRELKRKSSVLMQKVMLVAPSTLDDITDDTDGNDNDTEMEELRKTVKELTQEVSRLQAELNKIKLQEFEAQEQTVDLTSELEEERRARTRAEHELKELKMKHKSLETVSRKVVEETTVLHERFKREKEEGVMIRKDANKIKTERDVLARQSQLLMMDATSDEKIMKLLFEVEQLQRTLIQERQEHSDQLKDLQDKLESQSESEQIELYEEKLKLIEAELLCSQQRAEIAESQADELRQKLDTTKAAIAPPPPPPPPPPPMMMPPTPPPPPPMMEGLTSNLQSIKLKTVNTLNHTNGDSNAIEEIGNYLGLPLTVKGAQVQNGAIDAIINQIKGGRFSLKATDKEKQTPVKKQEPPPVVNEMMNVLGTLRRHPKRRASFKTAPADVAL